MNFTTVPSNKTENETDTVTFLCSASGNPVPTITWLKDGQTVGNQTNLTFTVFRNHSGNYSCFADNGLNVTVTASAYLDVQCMYDFFLGLCMNAVVCIIHDFKMGEKIVGGS